MKAKLNGREVNVLEALGPEVYGVADGILAGLEVKDGEFPEKGTAYLLQSEDYPAKDAKAAYKNVVGEAERLGYDNIPALDDITGHDGLVEFKAKFRIERPAPGETAMFFDRVDRLETAYVLEDGATLVEAGTEESEDEMRAHWQDFIIPIPPPPKNAGDELYLTLAYEFYDAIKSGKKRTEYREYTENWVKKILSHPVRTVKFQRGYGGPGRPKPEQMVWTVKKAWLYESGTGVKGDPSNPPKGILPDCIAIDLGKRVS